MRLTIGVVLLFFSVVFLDVFGFPPCPEKCKAFKNSDPPACDSHTGTCSLGCKPGYYGNTCNMTCDVNCERKTCQERDGSCKCSTGYTFIDDSCKSNEGVKCKFNNHCLHDTCRSASRKDCLKGCKPGQYGQYCQQPCSAHCSCDRESGNCTSCIPGWYGAECESLCGPGCLNKSCHRNRTCIYGCTAGLYGETCDQNCSARCVSECDQLSGECVACEAGRYGSNCECSDGCAGVNNDCNRDGTCNRGCRIGYFGEKCESTCPEQCDGGVCNMTTGVCTKGCESGYFGTFCKLTCANCQGGDCDANVCTGTDFQRTWIPFIMGGGLLLIFVVLAVFMTFCLQRMRDIMKDGVHLIGRKTAVQSVPDHSNLLRSVDTLHTGSKACGNSSDDTYDHLFVVKPPGSSLCFDDLENSSGYCAVRPICGVSDQLSFENDDVGVNGSDEEGNIRRSLISLYEGNASDRQEMKMDEATAIIEKDDVAEQNQTIALHPEEKLITVATQKEASPTDSGAFGGIMVVDEDETTSMGEAADGGPSLGEQVTEENSPLAVEDGNISDFTDEEGSINDTLTQISNRGKYMKPREQGSKQYVEVIVM